MRRIAAGPFPAAGKPDSLIAKETPCCFLADICSQWPRAP
jgi:hypothetical protein